MRERKCRAPSRKGSINCRPCFHPPILNNGPWMLLLWSAFCRKISGCNRPSSTASIGALSSSSLTPPSSNKLTFVPRGTSYQLAASSQTRPRTLKPACVYTAHGGRKSASRGAGSRGTAQVRAPFQVSSPSPPQPDVYEPAEAHIAKQGSLTLRADSAAVREPPPRVRARPRRRRLRSPRAPRAVRHRNRSPRLGPPRGAGTRPGRGVWLARRGPARSGPAHLRG